uniref:Ovule protein n=1 Tax=Heterorhabditis bacteriophora TaxID=37862 RepID=A0A1I7X026_HETBA
MRYIHFLETIAIYKTKLTSATTRKANTISNRPIIIMEAIGQTPIFIIAKRDCKQSRSPQCSAFIPILYIINT